jgi:hypothetical protein
MSDGQEAHRPIYERRRGVTVPYARWVATAAAALSAVLYFLIGNEVLKIGEATSGEADLLAFGVSAGTAFVVVALVVWFARRRWILGVVAIFDALVLGAYFAFAGLREPPFELWGLLIKVCQAVLLTATLYLIVHPSMKPSLRHGQGGAA